jgi:hypothetical protein
MMIPTVHLNGTSQQSLMSELETAHGAIVAAIAALRQVTVHGRDYYVQAAPDAYTQARHEMDARLVALETIQDELMEMHVGIQKQGR